MKIEVTKLISHDYQIDNFLNAYTPNALKTEDLEWNDENNRFHQYAEDIKRNHIVFSVRDINTEEDYGFFFLKLEISLSGNRRYTIEKVILDEKLTKEAVVSATRDTLLANVKGEITRKDYIIVRGIHMFYDHTKEKAFSDAAEEVATIFDIEKYGLDAYPDFFERLKRK